jgi:hypothetical protein
MLKTAELVCDICPRWLFFDFEVFEARSRATKAYTTRRKTRGLQS